MGRYLPMDFLSFTQKSNPLFQQLTDCSILKLEDKTIRKHTRVYLLITLQYNPQNEMLAFCKTKCSIRKTKRIFSIIPS